MSRLKFIVTSGIATLASIVIFQNCSHVDFSADASEASLGTPNPVTDPPVTPPVLPPVTPPTPCADADGHTGACATGLRSNLYVQPTTVGSVYHGGYEIAGGEMVAENYLKHPEWLQDFSIGLTSLNWTATENFRNPNTGELVTHYNALTKSTESAMTYMAFQVSMGFHLADGEPEGSYQFAIMVDDNAIVRDESSGKIFLNDQKPVVPCADPQSDECKAAFSPGSQYQHFSCADQYEDGTAAVGSVASRVLASSDVLNLQLTYSNGPLGGGFSVFYRKVPDFLVGLRDSNLCGKDLGPDPDHEAHISAGGWKRTTPANFTVLTK